MLARCTAGTARPAWQFDAALGVRRLLAQLQVASLSSFSAEALGEAHAAASALLGYAEHTQGRALSHVHTLQVVRSGELIELPQTTRRNLELTQTLRGEDSPTLFSLLDTCTTGMGSRLLKNWLLSPRRERSQAAARLEAISTLRAGLQQTLRARLKGCTDVERITARIALRQVRPRELIALRDTLHKAEQLSLMPDSLPAMTGETQTPGLLHKIFEDLQAPPTCAALLGRYLLDEPAALVRDGGVINHGCDADLDELRGIQTNCDAFLLDLETREKERTGIANLRVQFNKVHGFYIEVTQGQIDKVPDDYRRRQTLKNAERFITPELKTFEDKALSAQERALAREKYLYELLLDQLQPHVVADFGAKARYFNTFGGNAVAAATAMATSAMRLAVRCPGGVLARSRASWAALAMTWPRVAPRPTPADRPAAATSRRFFLPASSSRAASVSWHSTTSTSAGPMPASSYTMLAAARVMSKPTS